MNESLDVCSIIMGNKEKGFMRLLYNEEMFIQNKKDLKTSLFTAPCRPIGDVG